MLIDMWGLMKAYVSVKERDIVATKFVDIALDNGVSDSELQELIGMDDELDEAVLLAVLAVLHKSLQVDMIIW